MLGGEPRGAGTRRFRGGREGYQVGWAGVRCGWCDALQSAQVGDGTTTPTRYAPVAVSGLSSGVVMVAAGYVRARVSFVTFAFVLGMIVGARVCVAFLRGVWCSGGSWMEFDVLRSA